MKKQEQARKPLDQQGGVKEKPGEQQRAQDSSDPRQPRKPHFDESADRGQGSDPAGGRQAR